MKLELLIVVSNKGRDKPLTVIEPREHWMK